MAERECSKCGKTKDISDFVWRNKARGIRQGQCCACRKAYQLSWYQQNKGRHKANAAVYTTVQRKRLRAYALEYLRTHSCINCAEDAPVVLEFHHRKAAEKRASIAVLTSQSVSIQTLKDEIAKCDVLCANCHRRKTAKANGWYRAKMTT